MSVLRENPSSLPLVTSPLLEKKVGSGRRLYRRLSTADTMSSSMNLRPQDVNPRLRRLCDCDEQGDEVDFDVNASTGRNPPVHRSDDYQRASTFDYTESTMLSTSDRCISANRVVADAGKIEADSCRDGRKSSSSRRSKALKVWRLLRESGRTMKFRFKKPLTTVELRKKFRKLAERGDWDDVRKLLLSHDFANTPPEDGVGPSGSGKTTHTPPPSSQRESFSSQRNSLMGSGGERRPSYGERRPSFTRKESSAVAAAIREVQLAEAKEELDRSGSSQSKSSFHGSINKSKHSRGSDPGESVLHDVCRYRPPLDVMESALAAFRQRRNCTLGRDDRGRTPLHVAVACGASPDVIDALVRADPTPACMGDNNKRCPLHLTIKLLTRGSCAEDLPHSPDPFVRRVHMMEASSPQQDRLERTVLTVAVLKEAMIAHPGNIDFKMEDDHGFAPLDYAIDGGIRKEILLLPLFRRRLILWRSSDSSSPDASIIKNPSRWLARRRSSVSSSSQSQDDEVLRELEVEELQARAKRIEHKKTYRSQEEMSGALFNVFGIDEEESIAVAAPPRQEFVAKDSARKEHPGEKEDNISNWQCSKGAEPLSRTSPKSETLDREENSESGSEAIDKSSRTDEDMYNYHMEAYLKDCMADEEFGDLQLCDEDFFDNYTESESVAERSRLSTQENQAALTRSNEVEPCTGSTKTSQPVREVTFVLGRVEVGYDSDEGHHSDAISEVTP